jgi:hypothetical protein
MQRPRFMVLTGHLNEYPLADLIGILRYQRKTGRLLIEYPSTPCIFYFNNGDLVDVQLGTLSGFQAACVALSQPNAHFNFNPLIQPPVSSRAINSSQQKVIYELLGCWEEKPLNQVVSVAENNRHRVAASSAAEPSALASHNGAATAEEPEILSLPPTKEILSLPPLKPRSENFSMISSAPETYAVSGNRQRMAVSLAVILLLGLGAIIALTNLLSKRTENASAPITSATTTTPAVVEESRPGQDSTASLAPTDAAGNVTTAESVRETRSLRDGFGRERRFNREFRDEHNSSLKSATAANSSTPAPAEASTEAALKSADRSNTSKAQNVAAAPSASSDAQTVKIVMQIENGRVAQASVANRRPGMEAYEALALRIARSRRYPAKVAGQETVSIKVNPSKQ